MERKNNARGALFILGFSIYLILAQKEKVFTDFGIYLPKIKLMSRDNSVN